MMKKNFRLLALILTVCFVFSAVLVSMFAVGFGAQTKAKRTAPGFDPSIDVSKPVKIVGYLLGDAPAEFPNV